MRSTLFVLCAVMVVLSCSEKEITDNDQLNTYSVVLGHVCGWCAGADSLFITDEMLMYTKIFYCADSISIQKKPYSLNELNKLMELINIEEFLNISINTCNVCADGCDTWITVSNDTLSHSIRFGYRDSLEVHKIMPFIDALHEIQTEFIE